MPDQIKVLVVDDSSLVRKIVTDILEKDPMIKVIGTANNGQSAIYRAQQLNPDVITMDIEMPILDGLAALKKIIEINPKPVIMMSVLTQHGAEATFKALDYGAVDFVPKPSSMLSLSVDDIADLLISKIKSVYNSKVRISREAKKPSETAEVMTKPVQLMQPALEKISSTRIIGIGTSTGGPSALLQIFQDFPENFPSPVLVVQHMPEGFTKAFAERLDMNSNLTIKEAEDGDLVLPGCGYIAPGHSHMALFRNGIELRLAIYKGEKVSGHQPSIDVLFKSMAETAGKECIGIIMTGMGRDGADGINQIRKSGGHTIAQDEQTSVIYGMNRVAVQDGAIDEVAPLNEIVKKIIDQI